MKRVLLLSSILLGGVSAAYSAPPTTELPANFPAVCAHVYDSRALAAGYIYLAVANQVAGVGNYLMILDNDGAPVWYRELPDDCAYDFKLQPNGLPTYAQLLQHYSYAGGGEAMHVVLDTAFAEIDRFQAGHGYRADAHDFQWLPNGHVLLFGYYLTQTDLSRFVAGAYPNALVSGGVVQELDAEHNVVFQWRSWDHFPLDAYPWDAQATGPIVSVFHLNTIGLDADGHLLIATPEWVKKINRQTGEVLWHLGGAENEFTFVGVDPKEAVDHFGGHAFHRLANGHVLIYDGGNGRGTRSSQVHEYQLDEERKIAAHVWSYIPDPPVYGWHEGNAQRLRNGNTFIGWGGDGADAGPACTEVTSDGRKVFELSFENPAVESYRAFRFPLPKDITGVSVIKQFLGIGDHQFKYGQTDTGVTIRINKYTGSGYNALGVRRIPLAPVYPSFVGQAPLVLPVRLQVGASGINTIDGRISLDVACLQIDDPEASILYHRKVPGSGPFMALPTSYNPATQQVRADMTAFGEFIIAKPDLAPVALPPILIAPPPEGAVNETLPVAFDWTGRGFTDSSWLQVATHPDFNRLVVDAPEIRETPYLWEKAAAGTTYYWRVRTTNDAGPSGWSSAFFTTAAPRVRVTAPQRGDSWQRGREYFIRWEDNLQEEVVIELFQDGVCLQTIGTVPSTGAYKWEVGLALKAGDDYAVRISSAVDGAVAGMSDATFTIR
jgi:hypothetical protein